MTTKRAWILGAGFSYPLGGPLFKDIFSKTSFKMADWYQENQSFISPQTEVRAEFRASAISLFHWGLGKNDQSSQHWSDPEMFLQVCNDSIKTPDSAFSKYLHSHSAEYFANEQPRRNDVEVLRTFRNIMNGALDELALEVSLFLDGATGDEERWLPYKKWISSLTVGDTLITFNYDLAVETLFKTNPGNPVKLNVVVPGELPSPDHVNLIKLHGSVNWSTGHDGEDWNSNLLKTLSHAERSVLILAPGPAKSADSNSAKLWGHATKAIWESQSIYFVGYRFPESDVYAQQQMGAVLRKQPMLGHHSKRQVGIVLGPEINSPTIKRTESILSSMSGRNEVVPFSMYSQDFLLSSFYEIMSSNGCHPTNTCHIFV